MTTRALKIIGAKLAEQKVHIDSRGAFMELWRYNGRMAQCNFSRSTYGVIRGMHVQSRNPQGKLLVVVEGEIMDVFHDLRSGSDTYGITDYAILKTGQSIYLPEGLAHGFQCLTKTCEVVYFCTTEYDPETDGGFLWSDAKAPWQESIAVVSNKDAQLPRLTELVRRHEWMS